MSYSRFLLKLTIAIVFIAISIVPLRNAVKKPPYPVLRFLHAALSFKHSLQSDEARPKLSAEYRAFEDILRIRPVRKPDHSLDPMVNVREARSRFIFDTLIPKPPTCEINAETFEHNGHSVIAYWIDQHDKNIPKESDHLLIYLHGGGYMMGDINVYGGIECHLSKLFNLTILHVEYRLSPEHELPAAVEDTIAIYHALLNRNISASQLLLMGDSAGGGLSLLVTQSLIKHQLHLPRGLVLLSPWTDISSSGQSHIRNSHTEVVLTMYERDWIIQRLLGSNHGQIPPDDPRYSPLFGSFEGFPPMYINVGTAEILEDDSRLVFAKAREAGVDVTFEEGEHLMHIYPVFFHYFPEARRTLHNIQQWIDNLFQTN